MVTYDHHSKGVLEYGSMRDNALDVGRGLMSCYFVFKTKFLESNNYALSRTYRFPMSCSSYVVSQMEVTVTFVRRTSRCHKEHDRIDQNVSNCVFA